MKGQRADVTWRDGVPVAAAFDDPYFSLVNGLEETRHVFLAGNDLPARFEDGITIAELGFGTGLNLLATILAWDDAGAEGSFDFISFEAFMMSEEDRVQALAGFSEVAHLVDPLVTGLRSGSEFQIGPAHVRIIEGPIQDTLPQQRFRANVWFLDGFSPDKNPEMWNEDILSLVGRLTEPGGSFATYTAAGHVRRALSAAGFEVERVPGFGRKRHMSRGVRR